MCECLDKDCPRQQLWVAAVRSTTVSFFTTLSAALRDRYRVHEHALCGDHCPDQCDSEHDTVDMDALNPHLDPFYRFLDAARVALISGRFKGQDQTAHLLRAAFESVERRYWRQIRKACRQAEQLMHILRGREFRVKEDRLDRILRNLRDSERRIFSSLEPRPRSDAHLIAHAASAPLPRRRP